ncbi:MAG TPA: amino-acid N-acetyltransferase [Burkholderiales bacterium]|nr:amino-acid N-acetyltransferase [Burkholderiales bacterium]
MTALDAFVQWFRSAAPYIHAFRGCTFVVAFGGEVVADGKFVALTHDLNLLASLGVRLVLVHGTRPQIESRLKARGNGARFVRGIRVTDAETMRSVKEAAGQLRVEIEALLSMGLPNSPMANAEIRVAGGNFITARPRGVFDGVDMEHTGEVRQIHADAIRERLDAGDLVLISPLGYSPTGEIFNLTMEDVAAETAIALRADKLLFLTEQSGVTTPSGQLQRELTVSEAELYLREQPDVPEDARLYLPAAIRACRSGVARVHLLSRHVDGALLQELFTHDGVGTMITRDPLEQIRSATIEDIGGILQLIEPLEQDGSLVKRSRELLEREIDRFSLLAHDGIVVGCAALYPFPADRMGELACLAVHPDYRNAGAGDRLLRHVEAQARRAGIARLFVLTTRAAHWFVERGFVAGELDALPQQKQQLYNYQRRSQVFIKALPD